MDARAKELLERARESWELADVIRALHEIAPRVPTIPDEQPEEAIELTAAVVELRRMRGMIEVK